MSNYAHRDRPASAGINVDAGAFALLLGRICFASDFLLFGSRKFANPSIIYNLLEAHHLPGQLVYPTIVLQLGCGLLVLLGLQTRLAAAALALFCIVAPSIFWLDNLENLSRDYAAAGGLMLLCLFGPGSLSLDARFRNVRDLVASRIPAVADNTVLIDRIMLVARALIAFPFLADVVKKSLYLGPQRALLEKHGIPGDAIYLVMLLELVFGLAVLLGYRTRLAALVLLAWTTVLGFVIHYPGYEFSLAAKTFGEVVAANFYNRGAATFFKDITTIGALLMLLVYGPGAISCDGRGGGSSDARLSQVGNELLDGFDQRRRRLVEVRDQLLQVIRRRDRSCRASCLSASATSSGSSHRLGDGLAHELDAVLRHVGREQVGPAELGAREHEPHQLTLLVGLGVVEDRRHVRDLRHRRFLRAQQMMRSLPSRNSCSWLRNWPSDAQTPCTSPRSIASTMSCAPR